VHDSSGAHISPVRYEGISIGNVTYWDLAFLRVCHVRWEELDELVRGSTSTDSSLRPPRYEGDEGYYRPES
jgi:hypothetical protein